MSNTNLSIKLHERKDRDGEIYFVGKLKMPANIDLTNGVTFLIYTADKGAEELQLAPMQEKKIHDHKEEE